MKVSGTATLSAPPQQVFAALNDPAVLVRTIPGVEQLEQLTDDRYKMTVTAGVASIKGSYDGEVMLSDLEPPHAFTLKATGAGAPGTVDATVKVRLAEEGSGTLLSYDADAVVGGMVGGVGQRMLTGVAKKMAGLFFSNVDAVLTGAAPERVAGPVAARAEAPVQATAEPSAAGAVFRAPATSGPGGELNVPFWMVLAGVGAGAFWALAGVLVGWRIARRRD
ncbi:MAG: SRPBCC family protein [Actinomycetes bacterium]